MHRRRSCILAVAILTTGCSTGHVQAYRHVLGKRPPATVRVRHNGLIAFVRAGSVYGIRPDGTGPRRLLDGGGYSGMAWSPDGSEVALNTFDTVVLRRRDGSGTRTLLHEKPSTLDGLFFMNLAWSPDGKVLAVDEVKGSIGAARFTVQLTRTDGRLHEVASHSAFASWGPGGRLFYEKLGRLPPFDTTGQAYDALHVLDWKGDRELARDVHLPTVSPDGRRVAYVAGRDLMLLDLRTLRRRLLLTPPAGYAYQRPSWSPDGRELVAQLEDTRAVSLLEIWIVRADGTHARRVVTASDSVQPAWLPAES